MDPLTLTVLGAGVLFALKKRSGVAPPSAPLWGPASPTRGTTIVDTRPAVLTLPKLAPWASTPPSVPRALPTPTPTTGGLQTAGLLAPADAIAYVRAAATRLLGRPPTDAEWNWLTARANAAGYTGAPVAKAWLDTIIASASAAYASAFPSSTTTAAPIIASDALSGADAAVYLRGLATRALGRSPTDAEWNWLSTRAAAAGYSGGPIARSWIDRFFADAQAAYPAAVAAGRPTAAPVPAAPTTPAPTTPADTISGDAAIAYAHNTAAQALGRPMTDAEWNWLSTRAAAAGYSGGPVSQRWLSAFMESARAAYPAAFPAVAPTPPAPTVPTVPADTLTAAAAIAYAQDYATRALGRAPTDAEWNWLTGRARDAGYAGGPVSRAWLDAFLASASAAYGAAFPSPASLTAAAPVSAPGEQVYQPPTAPAAPPAAAPVASIAYIAADPPAPVAPAPAADLLTQDAAIAYAASYGAQALGRPMTDAEWNWLTARAAAAGYTGGAVSRAWLDAFLADASAAYPSAGF